MSLMRFTIIDEASTVSFIAPGNILKALTAGCSQRPSPTTLADVLEKGSKYDTGLLRYVMDGLAIFDEHYTTSEKSQLSSKLEAELRELLKTEETHEPVPGPEEEPELSLDDLRSRQEILSGSKLPLHPVLRVVDDYTRNESLQPVRTGLVIFNLRARRIIQVQNSYGLLQRSDRGRYFENGKPTDRLYFYRLPADWSLVP